MLLEAGGYAADVAALERLSGRMLEHYAARCAARTELRDAECDADREWAPQPNGVSYLQIREGTLCKTRHASQDTKWMLSIHYNEKYGIRTLTEGSWEHVGRWALDVAVHGLPGGPDYHGQPRAWLRTGDDDTLHAVTIGGEFRAMPLLGGGYLLMFARNDGGLCVLGGGELEQLQRTADERLLNFHGDAVRVRLGDRRVLLRSIGAATVLGRLELFDGTVLTLGHLAGDYFGLQRVSGEDNECLGFYTMAELRQGDLGQVLRWTRGRQEEGQDPANDDSRRTTEHPQPPRPAPERTREHPQPPRPAPERTTEHPQPPRPAPPPPRPEPAPPPPRPARKAKLSAADQELVDRHFTPDEPPTGPASTILSQFMEGMRVLASLGLGDQLLWASGLRRLMADRAGIEFSCGPKTFSRAIAATKTPMVVPTGRRYRLRWGELLLSDATLLGEIAAVTPKAQVSTPRPSPPRNEQERPPSPGPPASAPSAETLAAESSAATGVATSPTGTSASPTASTADAVPPQRGEPASEVDPPWIIAARTEARSAAATAEGVPDFERDAGPPWPVSAGVRRPLAARTLINGEPIIRTTLSSVNEEESASRSGGKPKIRGPPRG